MPQDTTAGQYDLVNGLEVFRVCARCHSINGWGSKDGVHPQIAGQYPGVLFKQVKDIREGLRDNPVMFPFSLHESIGDEQALSDVVHYISGLPMTPDYERGPWQEGSPEYETGEVLYKETCVGCHGETGTGDAGKLIPRIHGQHYEYLVRQLKWIRDGKRHNASPEMIQRIRDFSDDDVNKVINYITWLPVPSGDLAPSSAWKNPDF